MFHVNKKNVSDSMGGAGAVPRRCLEHWGLGLFRSDCYSVRGRDAFEMEMAGGGTTLIK